MSQNEIARNFPRVFENRRFKGLDFNVILLNNFLKGFGLNSEFHNPFVASYGEKFNWKDLELGEVLSELEEKNKDLLTAFENGSKYNHLALVYDFNRDENLVGLVDHISPHHSRMPLSDLFGAMHPDKDPRYGFYVVS